MAFCVENLVFVPEVIEITLLSSMMKTKDIFSQAELWTIH